MAAVMTEPVTIVSLALFQHMASRSARDCAGVRRKVQGGRFRRGWSECVRVWGVHACNEKVFKM
jgi:hypothetical protein